MFDVVKSVHFDLKSKKSVI